MTWSTSDQLHAGENGVFLKGITVDPSGNAFACGRQNTSESSPQKGFVRRLQAPVTEPTLSVRTEITTLIVTWPSSAVGFALQSAAALANGTRAHRSQVLPTSKTVRTFNATVLKQKHAKNRKGCDL
jgi:hypothetical protein